MVELISNTLDYWVAWHFALAILAYLIFYKFTLNKQKAMIYTLGLTLAWEILDSIAFGDSFKNSCIDFATSVIAIAVAVMILKDRKLIK